MAIIRDVMPAFELVQPTSVDDAVALLPAWNRCMGVRWWAR